MRGPRDSGTPQQSHTDELPEELEDTLGLLVRLSEHRLGGLSEDAALGELHHFLGHVDALSWDSAAVRFSDDVPRLLWCAQVGSGEHQSFERSADTVSMAFWMVVIAALAAL